MILIQKGKFINRVQWYLTDHKGISQRRRFYMGHAPQTLLYPPPLSLVSRSSHLSCPWRQRDSGYYLRCGLRHQLASSPALLAPWMSISLSLVLKKFCRVPDPFPFCFIPFTLRLISLTLQVRFTTEMHRTGRSADRSQGAAFSL